MKKKFKILLFSTKGAGNHYYGPGISAYRLYKNIDKSKVSISLVHGYKSQENMALFDNQYYLSDLTNGGLISGVIYSIKVRKWIKENAHRYDVLHCLGGYHASFMMAYLCEKEGLPAFIKITESINTGFTKSSFISNLLRLRKFRIKHANDISGYISISSEIKNKLLNVGIK